ncbi:MAG TPA: sugar ABC transporter ATP-binding protein, partial [Mesotoga infera]|nr:sugar ABC transporter ATP-binding protein [Mesotoga infera]
MSDKNIVLKTVSISKSFPGVKALNNVDFDLLEGEIHAICGENGAGKSTLCNVLTGIVRPDEGNVFLNGAEVRLTHPSQALRLGIRMVYQERNLIPYLTGAQNILLREEPVKGGFLIDEKAILSKAEDLSELYNLRVPLGIPVALLSSAQRQAIEILRAFLYKPKILILDEPTSSLTEAEVKSLFSAIHQIKDEGVSVILITHKLEEVFENADRISIFRNGERVTTRNKEDLSEEEAIRLMVNRNISSLFPEVTNRSGDMILQVENLSGSGFLKDISIHLNKGEVLGLYGLIGSGRTEFIEHLYGLRETKIGRVIVKGKEVQPNVHRMIEEGVFLVPDDRREKGLLTSLNLKKNLTISYIDEFSRLMGVVSAKKENSLVKSILDKSSLSLKYSN